MSPVKQVVISSKKEIKCNANHIFMPHAQMATFVWSYHVAGTNAQMQAQKQMFSQFTSAILKPI